MSSLPVFLLVWSALKQGMSDPVRNLDITVGVGSEEVSDGGGLNLWELNAGTKRVLFLRLVWSALLVIFFCHLRCHCLSQKQMF